MKSNQHVGVYQRARDASHLRPNHIRRNVVARQRRTVYDHQIKFEHTTNIRSFKCINKIIATNRREEIEESVEEQEEHGEERGRKTSLSIGKMNNSLDRKARNRQDKQCTNVTAEDGGDHLERPL